MSLAGLISTRRVTWPLMSSPMMFPACLRTSSRVAANLTPPALPRPPILTCDLTITGGPNASAAATASSTVVTTRPGGAGTPCAVKISFAWYSYRSTCSPSQDCGCRKSRRHASPGAEDRRRYPSDPAQVRRAGPVRPPPRQPRSAQTAGCPRGSLPARQRRRVRGRSAAVGRSAHLLAGGVGIVIHDYCVIGGGIVGLATAMSILQRRPGAGLVVLEKEDGIARHQTGHNSGVIHSGIYYQPGSLKAELCRRGAQATKDFCRDHGIPVTEQGKLLVATDERDAERMTGLEERARDNCIDVVRLSSAELRDLEPHVRGVGALLVPATGSVDYTLVCKAMADVVRSSGGQVELGVEVTGLDESAAAVAVSGRDRQSADRQWTARQVVVCAGLQADRLARMAGATSDARIIPFRGEYYRLPDRKSAIVQHLIYPIPDPDLPFLGVHLTPMVDGRVTVGPNAVLGLSREGYRKLSVSARDVADFLSFPGFWNLARRNVRTGAVEVR